MGNSVKIDSILTSKEAKKILGYISPIYDDAYAALHMLEAIGLQLDDIAGWTNEMFKAIIPQAMTGTTDFWALPYWESEYGVESTETSTERRLAKIYAAIRTRYAAIPYRLAALATAACGVSCRVAENTVGTSGHTFDIYVKALSSVGIDETAIKNAVNQAKPSHLLFRIKYEQGVETSFYPSISMKQVAKIFTIGQVN